MEVTATERAISALVGYTCGAIVVLPFDRLKSLMQGRTVGIPRVAAASGCDPPAVFVTLGSIHDARVPWYDSVPPKKNLAQSDGPVAVIAGFRT